MLCIIPRRAWTLGKRLQQPIAGRLASTSSPLAPKHFWGRSRDIFISQSLEILHRHTNEPLWRLLTILGTREPWDSLALAPALKDASIPVSDYHRYQRFLEEIDNPDPLRTLAIARAGSVPEPDDTFPTWVFLHLLTQRCCRTSTSMDMLLDPLMSQLSTLPLHQRAPMLIFAAAHFATWSLLLPLQRIVHEFLSLPHPIATTVFPPPSSSLLSDPEGGFLPTKRVLTLDQDGHSELYFNLFLRALACSPKYSTPYSNYVLSTIKQLSSLQDSTSPSREFKIHPDTYSCLLLSTHNVVEPHRSRNHNRLLSPRLLGYLRSRMRTEGFQPRPVHLEAMLRFWAKEAVGNATPSSERSLRAKAMTQRVWEEIQRIDHTQLHPIGHPKFDSLADPILRSNTLYIGAQNSVQGIREVLTLLQKSTPITTPPKNLLDALPLAPVQHSPLVPKTKPQLDKYDLTSTLHSAANDMNISSNALMKMFNRLSNSYGGPTEVPLAAHTVFLRGLIFRKHFKRARKWWMHNVVKGKHQLDRIALTVGAQILTRGNRPHEAFALLERHSWKPSDPPPPISSSLPAAPTTGLIRLTSISVGEWMVSLKRIARPDVVFQLWDYMNPLYGVLHTNETLNIMLQSARMAVIMDGRSVRTQVSNYFKLGRAKFSSTPPTPRVLATDAEVRNHGKENIRNLLGDSELNEPVAYRGGLWRDKRPEDTARDIFLQIMFGMEAEMAGIDASLAFSATTGKGGDGDGLKVGLANVKAPACAVREDWDSDAGVVGLGVGLAQLKLHRFEYTPGPETYDWQSGADGERTPRSRYPHLSLDNTNFLSYISLLAVTNRTPEVALTFAWMRELGIQPSESTLALGMVLWGEVSVEAPLVRAMARGGGNKGGPVDEYDRFMVWVEGWVGERRIPADSVLRKWRAIVRNMREARSPQASSKDNDTE